jgi:mannose/fructose/N-acetylgalactosamine-specific phosphotransferase system component IIC
LENVYISLIGSLIVLDTTVAFQFLISQPLIACTLLGWFLGDPYLGMQIGIFLQLLWLSNMPVGAAIVPEGNFAAIVITALVVRYSQSNPNFYTILIVAILFGVLVSYIGGQLVKINRKSNAYFLKKVIVDIKKGNIHPLSYINFLSLIFHYLGAVLAILVALNIGDFLYSGIEFIPVDWEIYFKRTSFVVLGVGAGLIIPVFSDRYSKKFVIAGCVVGILMFFVF